MYEFDFGSELITLHSRTPLHLLDEGILADGRLVFASVPHADGSRATVLGDTLRYAMRKTLCSASPTNNGRSPSSAASEGQAVTWKAFIHRPDR